MSLFPRFSHEISPLFRLIDDYDRASRAGGLSSNHQLKAFSPKFDVKEVNDAYELHGELPGLEQKNINITWDDSNTLTISGRTESRYESGSPSEAEEVDNGSEKHDYHKPTVEEEGESTTQAVTKVDNSKEIVKESQSPKPKYWVTERSVGEFHRSFSFPGRVDQDAVKASLKNGILSIVVPKAQAPKARRINIE